MLDSLADVVLIGIFRIRWGQRQEFGTRKYKAILELGEIAVLHFVHLLVVVLVPQSLLQALVDALRMQNQADGEEMIHLLGLLVDLVVLIATRGEQLLRALDVQQNAGERSDRVRVTAHHHIREADVVCRGDLAAGHVGVRALLVELHVLQDLNGLIIIAQ